MTDSNARDATTIAVGDFDGKIRMAIKPIAYDWESLQEADLVIRIYRGTDVAETLRLMKHVVSRLESFLAKENDGARH